MIPETRIKIFSRLYPTAPSYRWRQAEQALFNDRIAGWDQVTTLSGEMKEGMAEHIGWLAVKPREIAVNKAKDTYKAALELADGTVIESVLMANSRGQLTVCASTQVGCSMACRFCATGQAGLTRNLNEDEITDQYRFWRGYLADNLGSDARISNLVLMGMGEPFLNYENVKSSLKTVLKYTDIGETRITVSTVGVFPLLDDMLRDKDWPNVRLAISLHGADIETRKKIVPSCPDDFFQQLVSWSKAYLKTYGNRRHHLSFEYIMIAGINDSLVQADKLASLIKKIGPIKVNLIPCNFVPGSGFDATAEAHLITFQKKLVGAGITATIRKSMGQDITAACGQLAKKNRTFRAAK